VTESDASGFPPNARIETLVFDDPSRTIRVTLRGETEARDVPAASIRAMCGARIRHDSVTTVATSGGGINFGKLAITVATGIPVGVMKGGPKEKAVAGQELHHTLALRIADLPDVWYMLASSFNFRKALGPDATYSTEMNLRLFVKRLASFEPQAVQDAYVAAVVDNATLPPPLISLLEFLRAATYM
jgi:hypothetical protein